MKSKLPQLLIIGLALTVRGTGCLPGYFSFRLGGVSERPGIRPPSYASFTTPPRFPYFTKQRKLKASWGPVWHPSPEPWYPTAFYAYSDQNKLIAKGRLFRRLTKTVHPVQLPTIHRSSSHPDLRTCAVQDHIADNRRALNHTSDALPAKLPTRHHWSSASDLRTCAVQDHIADNRRALNHTSDALPAKLPTRHHWSSASDLRTCAVQDHIADNRRALNHTSDALPAKLPTRHHWSSASDLRTCAVQDHIADNRRALNHTSDALPAKLPTRHHWSSASDLRTCAVQDHIADNRRALNHTSDALPAKLPTRHHWSSASDLRTCAVQDHIADNRRALNHTSDALPAKLPTRHHWSSASDLRTCAVQDHIADNRRALNHTSDALPAKLPTRHHWSSASDLRTCAVQDHIADNRRALNHTSDALPAKLPTRHHWSSVSDLRTCAVQDHIADNRRALNHTSDALPAKLPTRHHWSSASDLRTCAVQDHITDNRRALNHTSDALPAKLPTRHHWSSVADLRTCSDQNNAGLCSPCVSCAAHASSLSLDLIKAGDIELHPGPNVADKITFKGGPLDIRVSACHGLIVLKEVKRQSIAYRFGFRTGQVIHAFGDEETPATPDNLDVLRNYISSAQDRESSLFWVTATAKRNVKSPGVQSKAKKESARKRRADLSPRQADLVKERESERLRAHRDSLPSATVESEKEKQRLRMSSLRKTHSTSQKDRVQEANTQQHRQKRGGSPSSTPGSKRNQERVDFLADTARRRLFIDDQNQDQNSAQPRPEPQAKATWSQEPPNPGVEFINYMHELEEDLTGSGRERAVPEIDDEASANAWISLAETFVDEHSTLLAPTSDIDVTKCSTFGDPRPVDDGASRYEPGDSDGILAANVLSLLPGIGRAQWPGSTTPPSSNSSQPHYCGSNLPSNPFNSLKGTGVDWQIVRIGSSATSGHYVVLAAPADGGPTLVYDSLVTYTTGLENPNSPGYLAYLSKVAAVLQRKDTTRGIQLQFATLRYQQTSGSNVCGAYAAFHAVALLNRTDPRQFRLRDWHEDFEFSLRAALHDAVFSFLGQGTQIRLQTMQDLVEVAEGKRRALPDIPLRQPELCPVCQAEAPQVPPPPLPPKPRPSATRPSQGPRAPTTNDRQTRSRTRASVQPPSPPPPPPPPPPQAPAPQVPHTKAPPRGRSKQIELHKLRKLQRPGVPPDQASKCPHCQTELFEGEAGRLTKVDNQWCCGKGEKRPPALVPIHARYYNSDTGAIDREFSQNIRTLNSNFALSALRISGKWIQFGAGPSNVKVHGRIHHKIADMDWRGQHGTRESQLCILDGNERERIAAKHKISPVLYSDIHNYLSTHSSYYNEYERLAAHPSNEAVLIFETTSRKTHGPILGDMPLSNEIAGIIDDSPDNLPRTAYVMKKGEQTERSVKVTDPCYEPLQFPLLFPNAEEGWSPQLKSTTGKALTNSDYTRNRLLTEKRFQHLSRLGQEYAVDSFSRIEESRLNFLRTPEGQSKLRQGTREDIATTLGEQNPDGPAAGRVYLPASFTGGPRYMRRLLSDAMCIVSRFTCNPNWDEIQPPGDPAMACRVFKLKLQALLDDIRAGKIFNLPKSRYHLSTVEFQKRGLPHAHIIISFGKNLTVAEVDRIVRADLPGEEEPELRELVLRHMVHGPCGPARRTSPCMQGPKGQETCTKCYPKPCSDFTYVDDNGFHVYRRPCETSATIRRSGIDFNVTDLNIVPYNEYLLRKYEAHINCEIANTTRAVKYLFKYACKGQDRVKNTIVEEGQQVEVNEIRDYENNRLLSASEALWRIFCFQLQWRSPAVKAIAVHLPEMDWLVFREDDPGAALQRTSELTRYFDRPPQPEFDDLTLAAYYEQYREVTRPTETSIPHSDGIHHLIQRTMRDTIVRLHWISGVPGELFFLRQLLYHFPARSYEGLRTRFGQTFVTFQEAARAAGLIIDNNEFIMALKEATSMAVMPHGLRSLFVMMVVTQSGIATHFSSRQIWDEMWKELCDVPDLTSGGSWEKAQNDALVNIRSLLSRHGRTLEGEGLPSCSDRTTELGREEQHWITETDRLRDHVAHWTPLFNQEQRSVIDSVLQSFPPEAQISWDGSIPAETSALPQHRQPRYIYLDAPGGSGKTEVMKFLAAHIRSLGYIVLCVASTGIAALNYEGGITGHSMFKFPLDATDDNKCTCNLSMRTQRAQLIRSARLILYDEFPNVHKNTFGAFRRLLDDIRSPISPVILLGGDFRQIPPVIKHGTKKDVLQASVKFDPYFQAAEVIHLHQNLRARHDPDYAAMVLSIGNGTRPTITVQDGKSKVPTVACPLIKTEKDLDSLIRFVYPHLRDEREIHLQNLSRAILATTNDRIDEINTRILEAMPGEWETLLSADSAVGDDGEPLGVDPQALSCINEAGVPPHRLRLKLNTMVVITRNLSFESRLVNSTKAILREISPRRHLLKIEVYNQYHNTWEPFYIHRITFKFTVGSKGMMVERRQFPLRAAYSMTLNKSQGQTLSKIGWCVESPVFSHGQAYVAVSRAQRRENIRLLCLPQYVIQGVPHIINITYPQLLDVHFFDVHVSYERDEAMVLRAFRSPQLNSLISASKLEPASHPIQHPNRNPTSFRSRSLFLINIVIDLVGSMTGTVGIRRMVLFGDTGGGGGGRVGMEDD